MCRMVKGIETFWSVTREEAKARAIKLYKAWYRQIPQIVEDYNLPKTKDACRQKLRAEFSKNCDIREIRQIDKMVLSGQQELLAFTFMKKQRSQILKYWENDNSTPTRQKEFLENFLIGRN